MVRSWCWVVSCASVALVSLVGCDQRRTLEEPAAQAKAENMLSSSLRTLFANVEAYPTLKSNENVIQLQEQLTSTENQIGFSRQHYNASVLSYNNSVQTFPGLLFAGALGFAKREFFDAPDSEEAVPKVSLS